MTTITTPRASPKLAPNKWLVVLDLETTLGLNVPWYEKEIIEVRAVVICVTSRRRIAEFHEYVRPSTYTAPLDNLCTQLTGVTQADVDHAPEFRRVLQQLVAFYEPYVCGGIVVTVDAWDAATMLPAQCSRLELDVPPFLRRYLTLRDVFADAHGSRPADVPAMLYHIGMPLESYYTTGIDYGRVLADIVLHLLSEKCIFETESQRKYRVYLEAKTAAKPN
ncbi:hypothetical protein ACHHYP_11814 [Achlya hypogyna]|uniref:Exonuclease domain-containing protein n=1 Tax=Achlya hypogyna TaxID=1202772 RepID=A0A1V9YIB6_ACHHY|nr:hypothetical protein ACHHYP_11814 [Achlya hypogyna]